MNTILRIGSRRRANSSESILFSVECTSTLETGKHGTKQRQQKDSLFRPISLSLSLSLSLFLSLYFLPFPAWMLSISAVQKGVGRQGDERKQKRERVSE